MAISALALGTNPPNKPSSARSARNCQILLAKPISTITMDIPSAERSSMILRPLRSASPPQKGDAIAENKKVILKTIPDHMFSALWPVTPRCSTYKGRKGITRLNATPVRKHPSQATVRFRFQLMVVLSGRVITLQIGQKRYAGNYYLANYAPVGVGVAMFLKHNFRTNKGGQRPPYDFNER